jgi:hypothetical protein
LILLLAFLSMACLIDDETYEERREELDTADEED